ncbi:MAG: hypothetical protein ACR2G4_09960 [Pyrinomonadaceae bacterium]
MLAGIDARSQTRMGRFDSAFQSERRFEAVQDLLYPEEGQGLARARTQPRDLRRGTTRSNAIDVLNRQVPRRIYTWPEQGPTPFSHAGSLPSDDFVRLFMNSIARVLPESKRLEVYESLSESLSRRLLGAKQHEPRRTVAETDSQGERYFDKHESPEITRAFMRMMNSIPVENEERTPYTDEELGRV